MAGPKRGPAVPPWGWERPLESAPDYEIQWFNCFIKEWKDRGRYQFPGDEDAWKEIVPKLKITGATTGKIYNHLLGKVPDDELVWGHLVAALIIFGVEKIKGSAFGKRIQAKYPKSDITKLAYNEDGPSIFDNATKTRQRGNSNPQDDEDFTDELPDDVFGFGDFYPLTSSTSANKSASRSNGFKTGAHRNSAQSSSSSPITGSTSASLTSIISKGSDPIILSTIQKRSRPDQSMTTAFGPPQSFYPPQSFTKRSFITRPNPFKRAGSDNPITPRPNTFSAAEINTTTSNSNEKLVNRCAELIHSNESLQSENRFLQASNAKLKTALQKQDAYQITFKAEFDKLFETKLQEVKAQYDIQLKEIKLQYNAQLLSTQQSRNKALSDDISVIREQNRRLTTLLGDLVMYLDVQNDNEWQHTLQNHGLGQV